jgi:hypothetical protein
MTSRNRKRRQRELERAGGAAYLVRIRDAIALHECLIAAGVLGWLDIENKDKVAAAIGAYLDDVSRVTADENESQ